MKPVLRHRSPAEEGSLITTASVTAAVIAILIGGMITYISNEYILNVRSHRWNQALNLAEAGVEMAFAEFNNYYMTGQGGFSADRGWYDNGSGSYGCYIGAFYNGVGENVGIVYSYVNGVGTANPYLFAYGGCTAIPQGPIIYRAVETRLYRSSKFPAAMVAKDYLNMNGKNVYTDSYDSTDPTKSTGGLYDVTKKQAHGDVASNETVTNTVDITIGNAQIYGSAMVGPAGTVTMGPGGSIGPTLVEADRADTIEEAESMGWVRNDFLVDIPDVTLPSGADAWAGQGDIQSGKSLSGGDYKASQIKLGSTEVLQITGDVRIYVTGDIDISGSASINIAAGASLTVYVAGSCSIGGNAVINTSGQPLNNQFYGLSSSTSWDISGNGQWIGTVYAPSASLALSGGGANGDMSGAIVANDITLNGQVKMHYDESLQSNGPAAGYNIASWESYRWTGTEWVSD